MTRTERRAESRDGAREHAHTFLLHGKGPRALRRKFGMTNKAPVFLAEVIGEANGKHIIAMTPSVRSIPRLSGGRTRV